MHPRRFRMSHAHDTEGSAAIHHYAVQAGVGQLGFNGQLLTPPVQRYGLDSVLDHWEQHDGAIIGVGSDELEGYDWPLDGRHYAPGQRPYLGPSFFDVPGFGTMQPGAEECQVTSNPLM